MSLRLQRITTNYPAYLEQFYTRRPALAAESYAGQHAALMADAFGWSDVWAVALAKVGYATSEIVANAGPLQKRWAQENGISYAEEEWLSAITLAQVQAFAPDVLWINTWDEEFGAEFIRRCRETCPSVRLVLGWAGEAHPDASYFAAHDLVLTCAPDTLDYFRAHAIRAAQLDHAFDPRRIEQVKSHNAPAIPTADVGFIGQISFGEQYHNQRARIFYEVAQQVDLALYGVVSDVRVERGTIGWKSTPRAAYYAALSGLHRAGLGRLASHLSRHAAYLNQRERAGYARIFAGLRTHARPPVFGIEMYRALAGFKICLNAHGPSAYASNMRLYEATGIGTCLLTDWKDNVSALFEPDVEVVTYRSAEECIEKIHYLLDHDDERCAIAAAGQHRTLRDHTFDRRAVALEALIHDYLGSR